MHPLPLPFTISRAPASTGDGLSVSTDGLGQIVAPDLESIGPDVLSPVCDVNEQCLRLLGQVARSSSDIGNDFVSEPFVLLRCVDASTQARAARFPFLLVDIRFRDRAWWRDVLTQPERSWNDPSWLARLPRSSAVKLTRATLILVWHTVRLDLESAMVLLGIAPAVAEVIGELPLRDIDRIAERHYRHMRPRWEDRPAVWHQLLDCAQTGDVEAAHEFVLHALQLTAGAVLPRSDSAQDAERPAMKRRGSSP